jgi:hypothetical protein
LQIAHLGYFSRQSSAFFPLYPLLIGLGGGSYGASLIVGTLISVASLTVGLYFVYRLALLDLDAAQARATVWLIALFPTAFFFSAVYSESLFLMLSVGAIYAARLDRWAWAGILGGLAGATRSNGLLIAIPLVLIYLYGPRSAIQKSALTKWWRPRYALCRSVLWLLLVPIGIAAYMTYLAITHDAPLAPFQAQAFWGREFAGPFGAIVHLVSALPGDFHRIASGTTRSIIGDPISWDIHDLIDLGFLAFAFAGLAFSWRRVPFAYFAYAFVFLGQALSDPRIIGPLASLPRYLLPMFPLFMGWGAVLGRRPAVNRGALVVSAALLAVLSGLWACFAWVA